MKVAIVVHDVSKKRGHDRYAAELISYLTRQGVKVDVFANKVECEGDKINFIRIPVIKRPIIFKILSFLFFSFLKIRGKKYDIIHSQGLSSFYANVITAHICHAGYLEVVNKYYRENRIIKRFYYRIMTKVMAILEKFFFNLPWIKLIISPSLKVKKELIELYRINENKIKVIYHGINLNEFNPENRNRYGNYIRGKYNIEDNTIILLFVGEFWRKGLDVVMKSIAGLDNIILMVVGPGDTAPYKKLAKELKIFTRVIFAGETDEIYKYYSAADIFVCPSHYESFGLVVTEAMASGIPVIISKNMGVAEIIENNENGIILKDSHDFEELREKIKKLTTDREFYDKLKHNGLRTVEKFSWERVANDTLNEYYYLLR